MPGQRLPMRNIRDVLRLKAGGMSKRQIASSLSVSSTSVLNCLRRSQAVGLDWPLPEDMTDEALESRLYPPPIVVPEERRPQPDWATIHRELKRPGVTLQLIWQEHRAQHPEGYGYSRFCELYLRWKGRLSPVMRQTHVAGEKLFVDYAGTTIDIFDGVTGEVHACQLFVATLGGSSLTYAEATRTQSLVDWIGSHNRALAFFGGVSGMVVSDNLKSGITKACFYEPAVNRTYAAFAEHYKTAIVPARPYKPRDKAKVESAVLLATRWVIAKLRNRKFFTLAALNEGIAECLTTLNDRVSRHLGASRRTLFETIERSALKPLPAEPFEFEAWKQVRAGLDYHVVAKRAFSTTRSRSTTTRCRTRCSNRRCGHGSRRARSRCSSVAGASPRTSGRHRTASIQRHRSTCRRAIGALRSGRRKA